jgi:hypothetical protein
LLTTLETIANKENEFSEWESRLNNVRTCPVCESKLHLRWSVVPFQPARGTPYDGRWGKGTPRFDHHVEAARKYKNLKNFRNIS